MSTGVGHSYEEETGLLLRIVVYTYGSYYIQLFIYHYKFFILHYSYPILRYFNNLFLYRRAPISFSLLTMLQCSGKPAVVGLFKLSSRPPTAFQTRRYAMKTAPRSCGMILDSNLSYMVSQSQSALASRSASP